MKFRVVGEHARGGQQRHRARRHGLGGQQVGDRGAGPAVEEHVVAAALVHDDGKARCLDAVPEGLPLRMVVLGASHQREHGASQSHGCNPLHLAHGGFDVPGRDHGRTAEARRARLQALVDPVVVASAAGFAQRRVGDVPDVEARGGIDALARDAVAAHDLEAPFHVHGQFAQAVEVPRARLAGGVAHALGVEEVLDPDSPCELRGRVEIGPQFLGQGFGHGGRELLAPEPAGLLDVAVRGDQGEVVEMHGRDPGLGSERSVPVVEAPCGFRRCRPGCESTVG